MGALQNYRMDMDMQMEMSLSMLGESLDVDMAVTMVGDMQTQPMRCKMDVTMEMLG